MKIKLTDKAWRLMRGYVDLCRYEISGLGKVERDDGGNFIVTDIAIFRQNVSGAHSDIEASALAEFQVERMRAGENMKDWYFWWHSHATMGVFFSTRDTTTIDESKDFGVLLSLVTNHKHEFAGRVDVFDPVRLYTDLDVEILEERDTAVLEQCQKEIDAKVTAPSAYSHYDHGGYRRYGHDGRTHTGAGIQKTIGFNHPSHLLPSAQAIDTDAVSVDADELGGTYDDYIEEKAVLKQEVTDAKRAKDKRTLAVAKQLLAEHLAEGRRMGFEN